jgi:transglutaminase-like putative cysteine protease
VKYRVRHVTRYDYSRPVSLAGHVLHLEPSVLPHQKVLSSRLTAHPKPARSVARCDHYGNKAAWMFLDLPHERFEVTLDAVVDVAFPAPPEPADTPPWEQVVAQARCPGGRSWRASEFTLPSPLVPLEAQARAYALTSFPPGRPVLEGLIDLNARIRRDFAFRPGATTISTPIARVMTLRAGVCQDFSHLMISGLRGIGLPARYVSGYLRTRPPPGGVKRRGADASHAWVGAWLGGAVGWVDFDPTNDLIVRTEHVVLGIGRDYADVSPVRGVILGGGHHEVSVAVDLDAE